MAQKKKRNHSPKTKPRVRPADGWILHHCEVCGAENYCPPGMAYCNNPDCSTEENAS